MRREQIVERSLTATLSGKAFLNVHIPASKYAIFLPSFTSLSQAASVTQRAWAASAGAAFVLTSFSPFSWKKWTDFLAALTCLALITITHEVKRHVYLNRGRFLPFIMRVTAFQVWPRPYYPEKAQYSLSRKSPILVHVGQDCWREYLSPIKISAAPHRFNC